MQYNVAQVIYLLDPSRNALLPARVVEQVTKKTIDGEEESFYVEVPGSSQLLNISDFEGKVFENPEKVKDHLFATLKNNIESLVEKAVSDAVESWGETAIPIIEQPKRRRGRPRKNTQLEETEVNTFVDLGDGRVARLKQ